MAESKELVKMFFDLVKIDSVSGSEDEIADRVLSELQGNVDIAKFDKAGNVYARVNGKGTPLFLCAHMDTVEPGKGIKPMVDGEYLKSDGKTILGSDDKAALACLLMLAKDKAAKKNNIPFEFMITRCEETSGAGARNFDYKLLESKKGLCFDTARPVGTIITASPFDYDFDATIIGKEAHASRPYEAINVLPIFADLIGSIKLGKVDEDTVMNIGIMKGGFVRNTVPGEMELKGEIRSFDGKKADATAERFKEALEKVTKKHKAGHKVQINKSAIGYRHTGKDAVSLIKYVKDRMQRAGIKPIEEQHWGLSDANIINEKGRLCINLGYGGEMPHTRNERIKISELMNTYKLMKSVVALR